MATSIRRRMTLRNLTIDQAMIRAIDGLYELYYLYLAEHPELTEPLEDAMYKITDARYIFRQWHAKCWETDPPQFKSIFEMDMLLAEARRDVFREKRQCRGYFNALDRLLNPSSRE